MTVASISVKEARKILGQQSNELTDDQVISIILTLTLMAQVALNIAGSIIL